MHIYLALGYRTDEALSNIQMNTLGIISTDDQPNQLGNPTVFTMQAKSVIAAD